MSVIKKTTVYIDEELQLRFKVICTKKRIAQSQKIVEFIEKFVKEEEEKEHIENGK